MRLEEEYDALLIKVEGLTKKVLKCLLSRAFLCNCVCIVEIV